MIMAKDLYTGALLQVYGAFLSDKQREMMTHYFDEDLSLAEIAENEGTTRQAVSDIIRRGEALLKKYEDECGYQRKVSELKRICESGDNAESRLKRIAEIIEDF